VQWEVSAWVRVLSECAGVEGRFLACSPVCPAELPGFLASVVPSTSEGVSWPAVGTVAHSDSAKAEAVQTAVARAKGRRITDGACLFNLRPKRSRVGTETPLQQ